MVLYQVSKPWHCYVSCGLETTDGGEITGSMATDGGEVNDSIGTNDGRMMRRQLMV